VYTVYGHTCKYRRVGTYVCIQRHTCVYIRVYTEAHVCVHTCVYRGTRVCTYVCIQMYTLKCAGAAKVRSQNKKKVKNTSYRESTHSLIVREHILSEQARQKFAKVKNVRITAEHSRKLLYTLVPPNVLARLASHRSLFVGLFSLFVGLFSLFVGLFSLL